jgi:two-component system, NarL family, response regulator DegU
MCYTFIMHSPPDEEKKQMEQITIIIVDDHAILRKGVVDILGLEKDLYVVGQASDGLEGLSLMRTLQPQIAILDVDLPGMNGLELVYQAKAENLPVRLILLTAFDNSIQLVNGMRNGAAAYCIKDIPPEKLVDVVRKVSNGKFIVRGTELDVKGLQLWLDSESEPDKTGKNGNRILTAREMQLLTYLARGLSNKEIAKALGISHQTVKNHVSSILKKMDVTDRTQAVLYAIQQGWVNLPQ